MAIAVCGAKRITRGLDYVYLPNFRTVYHGHGATSYQNVQVDNHDSIPVPTNYIDQAEILEHTYHQAAILPIEESHYDVDHVDVVDAGKSRRADLQQNELGYVMSIERI